MKCIKIRRGRNVFLVSLLNLISFVPNSGLAGTKVKTDSVTVKPEISTDCLINPGKGWFLMGNLEKNPKELVQWATLGYKRYHWADIEPHEGEFHWEIIDNDMKSWTDAGKKFAFGIMCASTNSKVFYVTPKWVMDAGAKCDTFFIKDIQNPKSLNVGTQGMKQIPVFDDPIFVKKLENFINKLASRYDGNEGLAFIDIRSYGNWGEGHMYPFGKPDISAEKLKEHILIHRKAFKKTILELPTGKNPNFIPVYDWAVNQGIGLRRDGICGNSDGSETASCAGKIPAVFEFYCDYEMMKRLGWWDGIKDSQGRGFRLAECVENGRPTYMDLGHSRQSGLLMIKNDSLLITKLTNRMGYHFVLDEAKYAVEINSGKESMISLTWENKGVANIFIQSKVVFGLMNSASEVVDRCNASMSNPRLWDSDKKIRVYDKLKFGYKKSGEYRLVVGIFQPNDEKKPSVCFGNANPINNWCVIGKIRVK